MVRREWHSVRRDRAGYGELVGEWVSDTVARCTLTTAADTVPCGFTPPAGGTFIVTFRATDPAGRMVSTSFYRWATGKDWVPWNDESQFKMDVVPDRARYTVGDTATILFASPFTNAEAWITVEREGLLQQRRLTIRSGTTTLKLPITEALAPNAFVSIVVARGRSAAPGPLDDPGRPTIRVGYAELRVTPERKRLTVDVKPLAAEYRPGDTARVSLQVRDAAAQGQRSEVTLWAVDEGVLALTGYRTPDPIDLIYQPRGLGMRLASTLTTVAPQVAEGEKGRRAPGGGGGRDAADILRSRFQTTAFFLGSVVTDASGRATAAARLPDNLTTFRLMAVAVTAGDRYGSGQSSLLVTRPLVARPALPRFLRDGDRFAAGVVVNRRDGAAREAKVAAKATGAELKGKRTRTALLEAGRGREVRFDFRARPGDSVSFRFDATSGPDADAVALALPLKPAFHPRSYTVAGVLHDTASAEVALPADIDPARSTLELSLGTSPLAMIRGARRWLRIYPYWCSEQVASAAEPLVALLQAGPLLGDSALTRGVRTELARAVATLSRRQRSDGGIGLWNANDWTTPWLTAYAGGVLLDAREAGLAVDDSVIARLGAYLAQSLARNQPVVGPVARWYANGQTRLSDRVMAVDYLSRAGVRDRAAENELLRLAAQLAWEDRVRLALVLARGGDRDAARSLLEPAWRSVRVEGRTATLPAEARRQFYFDSRIRPVAYLLGATLAVEPAHPLVGPLVETLVAQGRGISWVWNTQDYGTAIEALVAFERQRQAAGGRGVRVSAGSRLVIAPAAVGTARDSSVSLRDLVERTKDGPRLRLRLEAGDGGASAAPVFYYLTVTAVPKGAPVRPDERGIAVERWYERFADGKPVTEVAEGELVRVRLKVTVPSERHFVVLDDALPAGLEAVDLSLRTAGGLPGPGAADSTAREGEGDDASLAWEYGSWDAGWWSPFDHKEMRDDKVVYVATQLWPGSYSATYVARATTPGTFVRPPAHAEEMYNPAVFGESDGGVFTVTGRGSKVRIRRGVTVGGLALVVSLATLSRWLTRPLPADLLRPPATGLVLLDRAGLPLRSTRAADGSLRRWVPLAEMDPDLLAAFLAVEDRRFYRHPGVDARALARAALADVRARRIVAGGSTITMQLARLLRPSPRTWRGKATQIAWALRLERQLSKQAILEQYLNRVPLGQGAVGVEAGATLYFGAHATELSLGQAALLAGLARAPSGDNPLVAPGRARGRRAAALARLVRDGFATPATAARASDEPVLVRAATGAFLAPHFTTLVAQWHDGPAGGLPGAGAVRTSLDLPLQLQLEAEVRHTVESLADRGASQAAAVVLDNATGEVLAWVGSPDFWADTAGQVDMVVSPRQPGSALKPFLYALAFDRGYTPASILPDIARVYQTSTGPVPAAELRPPFPRPRACA